MEHPKRRPGAVLWDGLNRGTAWLYDAIIRSWLGRLMTGYRRADASLAKGRRYPGRHSCKPMSPARLHLVESMESGHLFAGLRALFRALFGCPLSFYGLFGLFYGLFGVIAFFVTPYVYPALAPDRSHLAISAVLALLSLPMVLTHKTLADALGSSGLARLVFVRLLGVPGDRLSHPRKRMPPVLPYLAFFLALVAAGGALFIHPLTVPLAFLALGVLGLIFTYPEAGVVLSTAMLPVIWLDRHTILLLAVVILITWCSYGIKLLFLHRTIHFGLLDRVMLILGALMLLSGLTGTVVTVDSVMRSLLLFVCLSDYFLIVNLMTTRDYIRRCLLGVGVSVVLVTALAYLRLVPVDGLSWLEGSRAGNAIVEGFRSGIEQLSGLWAEHSELYLVLVFPWLYAYLLHTKRFLGRVMGLVCILLDLGLILMTNSVSALFCVVCVTLLFFLLLGHKWLSAGLAAVPAVGCGLLWVTYLVPVSDHVQTILSRSRLYKDQLRDSLWQMVCDFPAGIGVGEDAFAAVYPAYAAPDLGAVTDSGSLYFEILLNYGWPGLVLVAAIVFLFVQKGLTCLGHTTATKDRAMILGGISSLIGVLIFGTVRSFITSPRVFFTILLVIALCSAYENIIFDESDVLTAESAGSPQGEDRIYRRG